MTQKQFTKFNPEGKSKLTYGESLTPAMSITDQEDAEQYLRDYIAFIEKAVVLKDEDDSAENIAKSNLGYFAGYYDSETQERVNRIFRTQHPIFGKDTPTPEEALQAGKNIANGTFMHISDDDVLK